MTFKYNSIRRSAGPQNYRWILAGVLAPFLLFTPGCARTPAGVSAQVKRQLLVQMTVRGTINQNDHYFFAIDATGSTAQGPVPVIAPPWGNGWGAGSITHYVQVDVLQPSFYGFYQFQTGSLLASTYLGTPLAFDPIQNTNTIRFTLDLDQIKDSSGALPNQINVNFINTDRIPLDPNDRSSKLVDALGFQGSNYITLNVQSSHLYRNADSVEPESAGDVADPDLDITDWQVEVRNS